MEDLIELIDLDIWKNKSIILRELRKQNIVINERRLRTLIRKHNDKYIDGLVDYYIAHDNKKGYIKTTDKQIIKRSIVDNFSRAINQIKLYRRALKVIGELDNERLDLEGEL